MSERTSREAEFLRQAREKLSRGIGARAVDYRDDHHVAHHMREWTARDEGKHIRSLLVAKQMSRATHNLLHLMCPPVPVPNYQTLQYVAPRIHVEDDLWSKIDQYCELVEERTHHPKMKPIEKDICMLSIEATRMQLPFLRDGLINNKRTIIT